MLCERERERERERREVSMQGSCWLIWCDTTYLCTHHTFRFTAFLETLDELSVDVPKSPELLASFVADAVVLHALPLNWLADGLTILPSFSQIAGKICVALVSQIASKKGIEAAKQSWAGAGVDFIKVIPAREVTSGLVESRYFKDTVWAIHMCCSLLAQID
jgi:hypothetical protein